MKRSGGYTLAEALIVVAVSSVIFVGAIAVFAGSQDDVNFNQAKADIDTKLKSYVNQISTGAFAGNNSYFCSRHSSGRPTLTAAAGVTSGSNETCIFLGKAIQAIPGSTKLYVYDVLGLRNIFSGGVDTGEPVKSYSDPATGARPQPAGSIDALTGNFNFLFTEEYELPYGLVVGYARRGGVDASILKIYASLDSSSASSRSISVYTNSYLSSATDAYSPSVIQCIQEVDPGVCRPSTKLAIDATGWDLCVQNSDDSKRAKINIKPTSSGIITVVTDGSC